MGNEVLLTSIGACLTTIKNNGSVTPLSARLVDNMDALVGDNEVSIDARISDRLRRIGPAPEDDEGK